MTNWNRVAETCDDEMTKARSSRSERTGRMKYPNANIAKLKDEQDEFLAKALAFREIGRTCRIMAPEAVEERIKSKHNDPPSDTDINDYAAYKERHWPEAYQYALRQCGLDHLLS